MKIRIGQLPDCPYKLIFDDEIHWKLMQNQGIQTEACTFLLKKMSTKLKVDFYF